ncbi:hypothetical protein SteCoe_5700 [Stentor coeruleus]|uniref:U3 small nucleolar RNA-associated protein 15 C-terminal domain-containing protein n=1 Tax=Stentor coeruleus TaxID=5963 RepID=A0A1R2CRS0_9CILI|nr:hypothetical protein SteCoe_5700 [Stentor coeruleus]
MANYVPLEIVKFPRKPTIEASHSRHWKNYKNSYLRQDHSSITNLAVSDNFYAVTASARIRFFNYDNQNKFSLTRFRNTTIGGVFREDGELFSAGDIEGSLNIFQVSTKTLLRNYRHPKPSYSSMFLDKTHIASGCDDFLVRYWDLSQKREVSRFAGHIDYVRAVEKYENLIISGGMDGIIKLWDAKSGLVTQFDHQAPISGLIVCGDKIITAGHVSYKLWDCKNWQCLGTLTPHSKNITSLSLNSHKDRLITGSLDCTVKIHNLNTFIVDFMIKYPEPVLTVKMSPTDSHLIVGMADGKLSVRQNKSKPVCPRKMDATDELYLKRWEEYHKSMPEETIKNYRYFNRGIYSKAENDELAIDNENRRKIKDYDLLLRKFHYGEVLDLAFDSESPDLSISIIQELVLRNGLKDALVGRDAVIVIKIIEWLGKKIHNPKYTSTILPMITMVIDMYSALAGVSSGLMNALLKLIREVEIEHEQQTQSLEVIGIIDFLLG